MIPHSTLAWMVFTDDAAVAIGREDLGIPQTPVCFLDKAQAEEMAAVCGGFLQEDTIGVWFETGKMLGFHTAIVDEQGNFHYVTEGG